MNAFSARACLSAIRPMCLAMGLIHCTLPTFAAEEAVLNLYSARHYATDEALYENFTRATGIKINRVDADDAGILARLKAEGAASPADVILLVDAARLWKGEIEDLFAPVHSDVLLKAVPEQWRAKLRPEGTRWFGLSTRARLIVYDKQKIKAEDVDSYEKLADPRHAGRLCTRSGSHPYNLSLFGAMVEHLGEPATEAWLKGVVANLARAPKGGAVARHAKHPENALKFLRYLVSEPAQLYFADGNNEWPVVKGLTINNPALKAMGGASFKSEKLPASVIGMNQIKVQQMLDRVGFR